VAAPASFDRRQLLYSSYVLFVLIVVYLFNFIDRQLPSILAERIKASLSVSDAELGFLYGTAFAVFYAIFGIPLGRLADVWNRRSLVAVGLAFWSAMTAASGLSRSFGELTAARIGVGVGEASATPAAYSMLSDSFPASLRATAISLYSSGIYLGGGLSLFVGGRVLRHWDASYANGGAPWSLEGWQATFILVGLPGLLLALWVRTLREPARGQADGLWTPPHPHPFREFGRELRAVVPGLTIWNLLALGGGRSAIVRNASAAAGIAVVSGALATATGDLAQWLALGIGSYAAASWMQSLALRDRPSFSLIFHTPTLRRLVPAVSLLAFSGYGLGFWTPAYLIRAHGVDESRIGDFLLFTTAFGGFLGVALGGILGDLWRTRDPRGRLLLLAFSALAAVPAGLAVIYAPDIGSALWLTLPANLLGSMWIGLGASTLQDLMLPRMRAVASAAYLLCITFVGLALGPYTIGRISVTTDLRIGMTVGLLVNLVAFTGAMLSIRSLLQDQASLLERARAAGEELSPDVA
jgi:MFS family permease